MSIALTSKKNSNQKRETITIWPNQKLEDFNTEIQFYLARAKEKNEILCLEIYSYSIPDPVGQFEDEILET